MLYYCRWIDRRYETGSKPDLRARLVGLDQIPYLNLAFGLGTAAAYLYLEQVRLLRYQDRKIRGIYGVLAGALVLSLLAAKGTNYILFPELRSLPLLQGLKESGFTYYGGLLFFLASIMVFFYLVSQGEYLVIVNAIVPAIPLFHAVGRLGCFLGGCCYGYEMDNNVHFPVQLVESGALFGLFLYLHRIKRYRLPVYLGSYAIIRFSLEFLRGDDRGVLFGLLSPSQEIALIILSVVGVWCIGHKITTRKAIHEIEPD